MLFKRRVSIVVQASFVKSNTLLIVKDTNLGGGINKFNRPANKAIRHTIVMLVLIDLYMPILHHRDFFKSFVLITVSWKCSKKIFFLLIKQLDAALRTLLKGLLIMNFEQVTNCCILGSQAKKYLGTQWGKNP